MEEGRKGRKGRERKGRVGKGRKGKEGISGRGSKCLGSQSFSPVITFTLLGAPRARAVGYVQAWSAVPISSRLDLGVYYVSSFLKFPGTFVRDTGEIAYWRSTASGGESLYITHARYVLRATAN